MMHFNGVIYGESGQRPIPSSQRYNPTWPRPNRVHPLNKRNASKISSVRNAMPGATRPLVRPGYIEYLPSGGKEEMALLLGSQRWR
jgi:hypothetical protein